MAGAAALCAIFFAAGTPVFAKSLDDGESWKIMDAAQTQYENGEFGEALNTCEKARSTHEARIDTYIETLKKSLSSTEVKKAGDDVDAVYKVLERRNDDTAIDILDDIFRIHDSGYFRNSVSGIFGWLQSIRGYPEADYLMGKIYEAEGETDIAISFYERAWQNRAYLDIPDERFPLMYRLADLAYSTGNYATQEKYLLLIMTEDQLFGKPGEESPTLAAMMRTLESEKTTDKFFSLYRYSNRMSLKACQDLAMFYLSNNRQDRAFPAAVLSACIAITLLSDAVGRQDFEYEYASFPDLLVRSGKSAETAGWARDSGIWKSFLILARALDVRGLKEQAVSVWTVLSLDCPDTATVRQAKDELSRK